MQFIKQPTLDNEQIKIIPLQESDFDPLFKVASDPLIWEQHPNFDRYQKPVFEKFFQEALHSDAAFLIIDKASSKIIGCSRYYDFEEDAVTIGYTFIAREFWGTGYNKSIKALMINHAFNFVSKIKFAIGARNIRSQKATEKLGALQIEELNPQDPLNHKFIYQISK